MRRNQLTLRIWFSLGGSPWPAAAMPLVMAPWIHEDWLCGRC